MASLQNLSFFVNLGLEKVSNDFNKVEVLSLLSFTAKLNPGSWTSDWYWSLQRYLQPPALKAKVKCGTVQTVWSFAASVHRKA